MGYKRYPRRTVFCGHGIADPLQASPLSAERQTRVSPADLDRVLSRLAGRALLTFDDGYADNLDTALPILERHGRHAVVFVTTGFIDDSVAPLERVVQTVMETAPERADTLLGGHPTTADTRQARLWARLAGRPVAERLALQQQLLDDCGVSTATLTADYLDPAQLRTLAKHPLITIGAHTRSHPDLRVARDAELVDELAGARRQLEAWLDTPIDTLAYPYGYHDRRVRAAARQAGYRRAYSMDRPRWHHALPGTVALARPRIDLRSATARLARRIERHGENAAVL